jgi:hypothetical protein
MNRDMLELIQLRSTKRPEWMRDGITVRTQVTLSFWDRIRVLFGRIIEVETFTATGNEVGRTETRSAVTLFKGQKSSVGYEAFKVGPPAAAICTRPDHDCGELGAGPCNGFPRSKG